MTMTIRLVTFALAGLLATACRGSSAETTAAQASPREPTPHQVPTTPATNPDTRTPVPLTAMMANHQKQQMRDHLRVVQEITAALGKDDFDAIAKSAARISWSEQQAMMCKHMGAGAPGFAEVGEHFHKTADGIAEAARQKDRAGVIRALDATLQTCTGCHETFRQEIVEPSALDHVGHDMAGAMGSDCPMHAN